MIAPRISTAIPLHNEQEVLPELLRRLTAVLDSQPGGPHEMVFADDGSRDGTLELLEKAALADPRIVIVVLSRNFGHSAAISAALDAATGDVVVVMDGDLQDAPEAIPQFLALYAQGYDVVYAQRIKRKESWWLRACYFLAYRLIAFVSDVDVPLDSGDFGLLSRRAAAALKALPERQRFLRGLRRWIGFPQIGLAIERDARYAGATKYTLAKLIALALDGVFAFSTAPLRLAAVLGGATVLAGLSFFAYALYVRLFVADGSPQGFTALIGALVLLSGVQLLSLGVIGEYIGRIYEEVKGRPRYIVRRHIRGREQETPKFWA
ncbi:MAG TPA: glycosyltransferase family 2 protein [Pirellulales bacterium]